MSAQSLSLERPEYTVRLVGDEPDRTDLDIEMEMSGQPSTSRSSIDAIMGEKEYINLSWSVEITRSTPHHDDPYPLDMPNTIANMTVYGREDRTDGDNPELPLEYMYVSHFYVQPEARGRAYGRLLWDCHALLVDRISGDSAGKIGDDSTREAADFLRRQGVPEADLNRLESGAWVSEKSVSWRTDGRNITDGLGIERGEVGR